MRPEIPVDVLRLGDKVRIHLNLARWIGRHPTSALTVASITRTLDGIAILGLHFPPSSDGRGSSDGEA